MEPNTTPSRSEIAAWLIAAGLLLFVLKAHLLPGLLAGLLVYELVHMLAEPINRSRLGRGKGKVVAVALLAIAVVSLLVLASLGATTFFHGEAGSLPTLMQKMAEILEGSRVMLPSWLAEHLPADMEGAKSTAVTWLREHAGELQMVGKETGLAAVHILIGMVVGAMVSLHEAGAAQDVRPLARALTERATRLATAFRRVVFAQVRISAVNTAFTAIYLLIALPLAGVKLPLVKTMVAITFVVGLLPVIGNLISNTIIVVVSLSHSPNVALASLAFLVVVHKLEYFLNARIVGGQIQARAWELLLAMLLMEAAFGLPGVVAAPIYYAYLKDELAGKGLV